MYDMHLNRWSKVPLTWDDKEKMGLAQYHMVKWSHGYSLGTSRRTGNPLNMSSVFLEFTFQRRTGFFILQVSAEVVEEQCCKRKNFVCIAEKIFYLD